ncbi:hypothetical protein R3P38DRAFT_2926243 [Favolaschia claudopus]|uniref:Uncharacterized protein n=1 Tax=Favolaschia claudopus TaxID=2862362 RepID=A0AAW0BYV9_9AGAR
MPPQSNKPILLLTKKQFEDKIQELVEQLAYEESASIQRGTRNKLAELLEGIRARPTIDKEPFKDIARRKFFGKKREADTQKKLDEIWEEYQEKSRQHQQTAQSFDPISTADLTGDYDDPPSTMVNTSTSRRSGGSGGSGGPSIGSRSSSGSQHISVSSARQSPTQRISPTAALYQEPINPMHAGQTVPQYDPQQFSPYQQPGNPAYPSQANQYYAQQPGTGYGHTSQGSGSSGYSYAAADAGHSPTPYTQGFQQAYATNQGSGQSGYQNYPQQPGTGYGHTSHGSGSSGYSYASANTGHRGVAAPVDPTGRYLYSEDQTLRFDRNHPDRGWRSYN